MIKSTLTSISIIILFVQIGFCQYNDIKIDNKQMISIMEFAPADFINWIELDEFSDYSKTSSLTTKVYEKFNDDFDFIIYISNQEKVPDGFPYYGRYFQVSNAIKGIGVPEFSNAEYFGSMGKLKGVLHLPYKNGILYGPFLHELMHCWANSALPTEVPGHWGFMGGNVRAQLGGFQQSSLQKNVNGNPNMFKVDRFGPFANGGNGVSYSELELYMMGLIPLSEVKSFDMLTGIRNIAPDNADNSKLIIEADSCINYTSVKIDDLLGDRIPSWQYSQKKFRALFVIISPNALSADESSFFNKQVEEFCRPATDSYDWLYNFWEATGGMAILKADSLNTSLKETPTLANLNNNTPEFKLYPNPVSDKLNVVSEVDIERIKVYNTANQLIMSIEFDSHYCTVQMDGLASGIYFVTIESKFKVETRKIIVQ